MTSSHLKNKTSLTLQIKKKFIVKIKLKKITP